MQEKGKISIHTENIFPIIKKFLYSDHEIFLRELVSNSVDATQKIKRLAALGEYTGDIGDPRVEVSVNKKKKTLTIEDGGIGMTAEEIKKYINQILGNELMKLERGQGRDGRRKIVRTRPFTTNRCDRQNEVANFGRVFQSATFAQEQNAFRTAST